MRIPSPHPANRGFVLIEALVTLALITFGFLAILKLQSTVLAASAESKSRTTAQMLAEQKIEQLRNMIAESADFAAAACAAPAKWSNTTGETVTQGGNTFTRSWNFQNIGSDCVYRALTVRVAWNDGAGGAKDLQLATQIVWDDPGRGRVGVIPSGLAFLNLPPANIERVDIDYGAIDGNGNINVPGATVTPNTDGTFTILKDGRYVLAANINGNARGQIRSSTPFVKIKGRVMVAPHGNPANQPSLCGAVLPLPSSVGFCSFPLYHDDPDGAGPLAKGGPLNCSGSPTPEVRAAAYNCYVGEGWFGRLAIRNEQRDTFFNGTTNGPVNADGYVACPTLSGSLGGNGNGQFTDPGTRFITVKIIDSTGAVVGQTGALAEYTDSSANAPIDDPTDPYGMIDYVIFKGNTQVTVGSGNDAVTYTFTKCDRGGGSAPSFATRADTALMDTLQLKTKNGTDASVPLTRTTFENSGPSLTFNPAEFKPYDYSAGIIRLRGTVTANAVLVISGTISRDANANTPASSFSTLAVDSNSATANCSTTFLTGKNIASYTCKDVAGASGTLSLSGMNAGDKICVVPVSTGPDLDYANLSGNQTRNLAIYSSNDTCP